MARLSPDERRALLARFRDWLTEHRLPVTRQRELVAELVFESDDHLSVERLRERLRVRGASVGVATLYRTLDLLERAGFVRAHQFGAGHRRYEPAVPADEHGHLVCDRCGNVLEFRNDQLTRLLAIVADDHGFQLQRQRVEIMGTCRDCLRRDLGGIAR
jgi:Fur family ferric uptake transcriptional regulator